MLGSHRIYFGIIVHIITQSSKYRYGNPARAQVYTMKLYGNVYMYIYISIHMHTQLWTPVLMQ